MTLRVTDTVDASFKAIIRDVGGFVDAMYRPGLIYFVFLTIFNILSVPVIKTSMLNMGGNFWLWGSLGISSLAMMLFSLAVSYNWQRTILGKYAGKDIVLGHSVADQFATPQFGRFLKMGFAIDLLWFGIASLLSYLAFPSMIDKLVTQMLHGFTMASSETASTNPVAIIGALVLMVVFAVLFARARLVLSAIAAGDKDAGLASAFRISKGNSLRLFGVLLMAAVGIAIVAIGAMIALVILMIPIGFVAGLIMQTAGITIGSILFAPFSAALNTVATGASLSFFAGVYAFSYAQLHGNPDPFGTLLDKVEEDPFDKIEKDGEVVSSKPAEPVAQKQAEPANAEKPASAGEAPSKSAVAAPKERAESDAPIQYGRRKYR